MYDIHYGFAERPFQLTPDPVYYFESATHRRALSYLGYGLAQGEGFIVITGEVGAGKTMLVQHLMGTIDPARLTAAQLVTTQLDDRDLAEMVAGAFGVPVAPGDKAGALASIERFLHTEARSGRRCLLIVDEAQNLSAEALEELRMLSNFQLGGRALLQIFLLGQPEFRNLLARPDMEQLRQRVIATHHLEPMQLEEVEPYLAHRLLKAGWTGRPDIAEDAAPALMKATGGVPRQLNELMSRVLLAAALDDADRVDGVMVRAVAAEIGSEAPRSSAPVAQPTPVQPARTEVATPAPDDHWAERLATLERQAAEQDIVLRRVLSVLIGWVEDDRGRPSLAA